LLTAQLGIIALRHRQQSGKEKSVIETFFVQPKVLARLRSGPVGRYLSAIGVKLQQQGYSRDSIRRHLRAADAFGRWLSDHSLSLGDANPSTVDGYIKTLGRLVAPSTPNGGRPHKAIGLHHLLDVLQAQGVTSAADIGQSSGIERWLSEFDHYLDQVAGNATRTRTNYVRYARRLLDRRFGSAEPDWSRLQADYIADFGWQEAARMQPSSCGQPVTAIRSLLRFLVAKGVVAAGLDEAVPPMLTWRHAAIPKHISAAEVERVVARLAPGRKAAGRIHVCLARVVAVELSGEEVAHGLRGLGRRPEEGGKKHDGGRGGDQLVHRDDLADRRASF
jgi:hypothetical protein